MAWGVAFVVVATLFVYVTGANDGAALISLGLRLQSGVTSSLVLVGLLVAGPSLLGTAVARTFTDRLASFSSGRGAIGFLLGVVVALAVVLVLSGRGLPTSLTLALVGGVAGTALGAGLPVSWPSLAVVLGAGALAPLVGLALGFLAGVASRRVPRLGSVRQAIAGVHVLAYALQCLAYAANDGQKMFAVASVAADVAGSRGLGGIGPVHLSLGLLAAVATVFTAGALSSLHRVGDRLARGLVLARPLHVVSTEAAAATAVLGSSFMGLPVSMTQSIAAGVVGVAASEGARRVRWQNALSIGAAWLLTLPSAFLAGWLTGLLM